MLQSGLIGHTGFIGSHISQAFCFDACYNSKNISDICGQTFDLLVCAAPHAKKWWANQNADRDLLLVNRLISKLERVQAKRFILISSADVFPCITDVDESFDCTQQDNHPYGKHRLLLETFATKHFSQSFVVRLPGLFGDGLKKNIIFDLLHHNQLEKINPDSHFQWYDISQLWEHLQIIVSGNLRLVMLATEPIATRDIKTSFFPSLSIGKEGASPIHYDIQTRHADLFGGCDGYIQSREQVLDRMKQYVNSMHPASIQERSRVV